MKQTYYINPHVGDYVTPDGWNVGDLLKEGDSFQDSEFPGCQFRIPSIAGNLAVNVSVTGNPKYQAGGSWKSRCRIEFVGDGEPGTVAGGYIWTSAIK
jgi:hypothetical protein